MTTPKPHLGWKKKLQKLLDDYCCEEIEEIPIVELVENEIAKAKTEITKAFGGCEKCFGKGWASQCRGVHGAVDFGGDGFEEAPREEMNFCSCQRGKDLKRHFERTKNEGWNEALIKVSENGSGGGNWKRIINQLKK